MNAVLRALHLRNPDFDGLARLSDSEWRDALAFCDRAMLGLPLLRAAGPSLPAAIRSRLEHDRERNAARTRRLRALYDNTAARLTAAGIPFIVLKGFANCAISGITETERVQYDLDLYTPREHVVRARDLLLEAGYESIEAMEGFPTDHLPPLIRKTGWEWRGDYFDPEIPFAIELHFRFWDEATERIAAPGLEDFWDRRRGHALAPADAIGYSALHALRHLLRGNLRPFHLYELALALDRPHDWVCWRNDHPPALRQLESVAFHLAARWFGCSVPGSEPPPREVVRWLDQFAWSPVAGHNKHEIWLHLCLVKDTASRLRVLRRRLLPVRLPGPVDAVHLPEPGLRRRLLSRMRYTRYLASRIWHHLAAIPSVAVAGVRLEPFGGEYWRYFASGILFNLAMFVFVLIYNVYLLDLGLREDSLGAINAASAIGTVCGTLGAAVLLRRAGLRTSLLLAIAAAAAITAARASVGSVPALAALGFAGGLAFSIYAVTIAPAISAAVEPEHRAAAFSVFFASMIGLGVAGGVLGGYLPVWMHGKRPALLASAVLITLALWPARGLRPRALPSPGRRTFPRGPYLTRFLAAMAVWQFATGSFNPFFNAYFAHLHFPIQRIGAAFSIAQAAQVAAILSAPLLLRRYGPARAIALMMFATAVALGGLATEAVPLAAYVGYMGMQWMSEPGINALLMDATPEAQRGGAAALLALVNFGAQSLAAIAAGAAIARSGYPAVLSAAAVCALAASALFARLTRFHAAGPGSPPDIGPDCAAPAIVPAPPR